MFVALSRCVMHSHRVRQACAIDMCSQKHRAAPHSFFFMKKGLTGSRLTKQFGACLWTDARGQSLARMCAELRHFYSLPARPKVDDRHVYADTK